MSITMLTNCIDDNLCIDKAWLFSWWSSHFGLMRVFASQKRELLWVESMLDLLTERILTYRVCTDYKSHSGR